MESYLRNIFLINVSCQVTHPLQLTRDRYFLTSCLLSTTSLLLYACEHSSTPFKTNFPLIVVQIAHHHVQLDFTSRSIFTTSKFKTCVHQPCRAFEPKLLLLPARFSSPKCLFTTLTTFKVEAFSQVITK